MIDERIQRLEEQSNVIGSGPRKLCQRADNVLELKIIRYLLEALGDAAVRIQSIRQQHEGMTIECSRNWQSIRHLGKKCFVGLFGNGTALAITTKFVIRTPCWRQAAPTAAIFLSRRHPQNSTCANPRAATRRDLLLGRKIGEQWVETNHRVHNIRLTSDESRAQAKCAFSRRFVHSDPTAVGLTSHRAFDRKIANERKDLFPSAVRRNR